MVLENFYSPKVEAAKVEAVKMKTHRWLRWTLNLCMMALLSEVTFGEISEDTRKVLRKNPPAYEDDGVTIKQEQKWGSWKVDLANYKMGSYKGRGRNRVFTPCNCVMCYNVNHWKTAWLEQQKDSKSFEHVEPAADAVSSEESVRLSIQDVTSHKTMDAGIRLADIKPTDIIVELGCGIGEWAVKASEAGARYVIGFEYEYEMYLKAKEHIKNSVRDGRIDPNKVFIYNKDVSNIDLSIYGATIAFCYLEDPLLIQMNEAGVFDGLERVISHRHPIAIHGQVGRQYEDLWMYAAASAHPKGKQGQHAFKPMQAQSITQKQHTFELMQTQNTLQGQHTFTPMEMPQPERPKGKYDDIYIVQWSAGY